MDEAALTSFLDVTATAMKSVEVSTMHIVSYSTVTVARKLATGVKHDNLRSVFPLVNERQLSTSAVNIVFSTSAILQNSEYATPADLARGLTNEVTVAYADPATVTAFVTGCELLNSATITTSTAIAFGAPVLDPSSITEVEVTTVAPTVAPPNERNDRGDSASSSDNTSIVVSVVVSVVVLIACVGIIGFRYKKNRLNVNVVAIDGE